MSASTFPFLDEVNAAIALVRSRGEVPPGVSVYAMPTQGPDSSGFEGIYLDVVVRVASLPEGENIWVERGYLHYEMLEAMAIPGGDLPELVAFNIACAHDAAHEAATTRSSSDSPPSAPFSDRTD